MSFAQKIDERRLLAFLLDIRLKYDHVGRHTPLCTGFGLCGRPRDRTARRRPLTRWTKPLEGFASIPRPLRTVRTSHPRPLLQVQALESDEARRVLPRKGSEFDGPDVKWSRPPWCSSLSFRPSSDAFLHRFPLAFQDNCVVGGTALAPSSWWAFIWWAPIEWLNGNRVEQGGWKLSSINMLNVTRPAQPSRTISSDPAPKRWVRRCHRVSYREGYASTLQVPVHVITVHNPTRHFRLTLFQPLKILDDSSENPQGILFSLLLLLAKSVVVAHGENPAVADRVHWVM